MEGIRATGVVEDDVDKVVSNVTLLVDALSVVVQRGHHCRNVEDNFGNLVRPEIGMSTIEICFAIQTASIHLGALQLDELAQPIHKVCIVGRSDRVCQNLRFMRLVGTDVNNTELVKVDNRNMIDSLQGTLCFLVVWKKNWSTNFRRARSGSELEDKVTGHDTLNDCIPGCWTFWVAREPRTIGLQFAANWLRLLDTQSKVACSSLRAVSDKYTKAEACY